MQGGELDRRVAPALGWGSSVSFPQFSSRVMGQSGVRVYGLEGESEVQKVFLSFDALPSGEHPLVLAGMSELLLRGCAGMDDERVSQAFDGWGTLVEGRYGGGRVTIGLQTTSRFFRESLDLLARHLREPSYEEQVVSVWRARRLQRYHVSCQQPDVLSSMALRAELYGAHPYGYVLAEEDFALVTPESLRACWKRVLRTGTLKVFFSGCSHAALDDFFLGFLTAGEITGSLREWAWCEPARGGGVLRRESAQQEQSALVLGRMLPARSHLDWVSLEVAVKLLGGYFGSMLMSNLREEHGYTYGIHAGFSFYEESTAILISSEVGNESLSAAVGEIVNELEKLRGAPPRPEKLEEVKAYMLGEALRRYDGAHVSVVSMMPDALLSAWRGQDYVSERLSRLLSVRGEDVMRAADEWLRCADFTLSVSGPGEAIARVSWPAR